MILTDRIKTGIILGGLGIGNLLFNSGCETISEQIELTRIKNEKQRTLLANGQIGGFRQIIHDSGGNPIVATVDTLAYLTGSGTAGSKRQIANPQSPQQISPTTAAYDLTFTADTIIDRNGNGAVDFPTDYINMHRRKYEFGGVVNVILHRVNTDGDLIVKTRILNISTKEEINTEEYVLVPKNGVYKYPVNGIGPGIYRFNFINDKNELIGDEVIFEVVNSSLANR
jgi:hypothetical protein